MTLIDTDGLEHVRIRLDHIERELRRVQMRLEALPLSEPIPFPAPTAVRRKITDEYTCSFCGKYQSEVASLIAGPGNFICNECVELCHEIEQKRLAKLNPQ